MPKEQRQEQKKSNSNQSHKASTGSIIIKRRGNATTITSSSAAPATTRIPKGEHPNVSRRPQEINNAARRQAEERVKRDIRRGRAIARQQQQLPSPSTVTIPNNNFVMTDALMNVFNSWTGHTKKNASNDSAGSTFNFNGGVTMSYCSMGDLINVSGSCDTMSQPHSTRGRMCTWIKGLRGSGDGHCRANNEFWFDEGPLAIIIRDGKVYNMDSDIELCNIGGMGFRYNNGVIYNIDNNKAVYDMNEGLVL